MNPQVGEIGRKGERKRFLLDTVYKTGNDERMNAGYPSLRGYAMKKAVVIACLVAGIFVGSFILLRAHAEKGSQGPPSGKSRIGIVNLRHLLIKHPKYLKVQDEVREKGRLYDEKRGEMRKRVKDLEVAQRLAEKLNDREGAKVATNARIVAYEELEKFGRTASEELRKFTKEKTEFVIEDVQKAVTDYARKNGLDVVFSHNVETMTKEIHASEFLEAKACLPFFSTPGVDITNEILRLLK